MLVVGSDPLVVKPPCTETVRRLQSATPAQDVVGLAASAASPAITLASDLQPDIVCVDISMPDGLLIVRPTPGAVAGGCSRRRRGIAENSIQMMACAEAGGRIDHTRPIPE